MNRPGLHLFLLVLALEASAFAAAPDRSGTSDGLIGVNRQFKAWLKSRGVAFTEQEVADMGHVWPLWHQNLTEVVPRLFR